MTPLSIIGQFWQLLAPEHRRAVIVILGLMLVGTALETLGVGLVIPVLALMADSDMVTRHPALLPVLSSLGNPSREWLVVAAMLVLVGVYVIKSLFLGFLAWRQMSFVFGVQAELSQRLFIGYLRQPYTFHLQRNSALLIRNAVHETNVFTHSGLIAAMLFSTEFLMLFSITVLLLVVEPIGAILVVSALGLASWGFHRLTRNHILSWGESRQHHEGLRIQHLQQGLGGAKDVILLGRESDFLSQYQHHNASSIRAGQRQQTLQAFPRLWLELLAVSGLAMLVLVMIWQGKPLSALLPTLGLYAAAAFRLMPSANRVLSAVQNMRYSLPVINNLYSEVQLLGSAKAPESGLPLPFDNVLTLEDVQFHYPSTKEKALHGVSLSVPRGTSVGFIGGSGAGKSTLVDIILGLLTPVSGTVKVDGIDIQTNLRGWQSQIGYVPQSIFLSDDTLRRNVAFGLANDQIDNAAVRRAVQAAQLEQFVNGLPNGLETLVGERGIRLSGGQRQRIGIARALYHDPPVLVLDEATSSLDTANERGVMNAVRALQGDKTLIIVAHRLSTVEHCERLFRLESGRLVEEGTAADILRRDVS